jgi:hypothetical protein
MDLKNSENQKTAALKITEAEVVKRYPDHKRAGGELKLISAQPFKEDADKWLIVYDVENAEDASVEMIVDLKNNIIVRFKDNWA